MKELLTDKWVSEFCDNLRFLYNQTIELNLQLAFKQDDVGEFIDLTLLDDGD